MERHATFDYSSKTRHADSQGRRSELWHISAFCPDHSGASFATWLSEAPGPPCWQVAVLLQAAGKVIKCAVDWPIAYLWPVCFHHCIHLGSCRSNALGSLGRPGPREQPSTSWTRGQASDCICRGVSSHSLAGLSHATSMGIWKGVPMPCSVGASDCILLGSALPAQACYKAASRRLVSQSQGWCSETCATQRWLKAQYVRRSEHRMTGSRRFDYTGRVHSYIVSIVPTCTPDFGGVARTGPYLAAVYTRCLRDACIGADMP